MISSSTGRRVQRGLVREWKLHALSVFSLAVAFVCLGAALLVLTNMLAVERRWAHAGRASAYLKDGASEEAIDALHDALARVPGVRSVHYLSSGEARAEFGKEELDKAHKLAALPQEAFPASLEIDVGPEVTDSDLEDMVSKMRQFPLVDGVETYRSWTEKLAQFVRGGVAASVLLALVVLASVLAVVGSTMRLALQRRRTEVEVWKLVGATDDFVRRPFLVEGSVEGALGAFGAIVLLGALFALVKSRLDSELAGLLGVDPSFLPWPVAISMVLLGAILGAVAAYMSVRKLSSV